MTADTPRKPDFFIVGAPKCGTTAMYDYLAAHPQIFLPDRKEIHYFGSDLTVTHARIRDEREYLACFIKAGGAKRVGEGSVYYLFSETAAREIHAFNPDARIIISLRNPVQMLYSLHSQLLFSGNEVFTDFAQALAAESDRARGVNIPACAGIKEVLQYRKMGAYAEQVRRYFDTFGHERVLVNIFDDFKRDAAAVYRRTLEFLEVDPDFQVDFAVINPNKQVRSKLLHELVYKTKWARSYKVQRLVPEPIRRFARRWNTRFTARPPLDPAIAEELSAYFAPQIDELGELLGRDLSHWCEQGRNVGGETQLGSIDASQPESTSGD